VNRVICPSEASRDILLRAFSAKGKRLAVIPHEPLVPAAEKLALPDAAFPMHIAVVGQITVPKGAAIVRDLALLMRGKGVDGRITIVGTAVAPKIALPDTVRVTGPYEKKKLGDVLRNIGATVSLIPSVWPETFNYVCQELMALGLPLACFDLGAPAERVRKWEHGLVAKSVSAEAALETLRALDARRSS
jgi:glycosyltransferase involved in cell wall biosynthesis